MNTHTNNQLLEFANHWNLDGDYIRCRKCNRPHIASKSEMPFSHMSGCKLQDKAVPHPWLHLRNILNMTSEQPRATGDGFRNCEFCGCHTSAKQRFCCDKGMNSDKARYAAAKISATGDGVEGE